ncbi:MAG: hypothetical protein ABL949_03285 [Fimbriimonadaceae bacterium]
MKRWIVPTALGCVAVLLGGVLGPSSAWLATGLVLTGMGLLVYDSKWLARLRRGRYSLEALREADEKARFRQVEDEHMEAQFQGGYCLACDDYFPQDVKICPRCGRAI